MQNEHGKKDVKTFFSKANPDQEKEFLGAESKGEYINARNARPNSIDGETGSLSKIKGEEIQYSNFNLGADYQCIGQISVSDHQVELWASDTPGDLDSIRIDGQIMVQSDGLLFDTNFPFQLDKNESCMEGEVFLTDDKNIPLILNLDDIISEFNSGSAKYFADFNRKLYEINLSTPLDIPVFISLENVGGGAGLPVGEYSYAIRYVNDAGDRTNFGPTTPLIPVLQGIGADGAEYPYTKTRGGDPDLLSNTSYGIKLRFRVTNLLNYDSIEVRRYAWNTGSNNFTPEGVIIARIPISDGQITVEEIVDPIDSNVEEVIPDTEDVSQLSFIEKAKAIRYYDKKLVLMNYSTANREMAATFVQRNGVEMFPIVEKLGIAGHNDPYFHAYKKGYMGGEEYGFAIQGYDGVAGKGFALGVTNFNSYRFPNRREEVSGDSLTYSYNGVATAANINSTVTPVFEAFDLADGIEKSDVDTFKNISNDGGKEKNPLKEDTSTDPAAYGGDKNIFGKYIGPYSPYRPTSQNDSSVSGMKYRVNTRVKNGFSEENYNPSGFAPNYYTKGIALNGIDDLPEWVKAFSVTRTKRAGRVVAQGLGMYSLNQADYNLSGLTNGGLGNKDKNELWVCLPDVDGGVVNESVIDDIVANPSNYSIQFVSPLGFFSELYNFERDQALAAAANSRDRICDMITYARVLRDSGEINPTESGVGVSNYVAYNRYRNSDAAGAGFFNGSDGNKLASISGLTTITEGRNTYYKIDLVDNIYNTQWTSGDRQFVQPGLKDFTEPFYMINIVQDGESIVDKNIDNYLDTHSYVKVESIIGEGDGITTDPSFLLVDERWEDCIPALDSFSPLAGQERFVWIDEQNGTVRPWINVTFLTPAQIATVVNDINTNGFYTTPGGVDVYGVYTNTVSADQREFTIDFNIPGFNVIDSGYRILVRYNNDSPIQVFGGDTTVGDYSFCPIDRKSTGGDSASNKNKQFALGIGFPFLDYYITPRHYVISNSNVSGQTNIQNSTDSVGQRIHGRLSYIRQMAVNFIVESRIATHFAYEGSSKISDKFFPSTHYIIRPNRFSDSKFSEGATSVYDNNNIYAEYEDDYGDEYLLWEYGGFRTASINNIDYSQEDLITSFSKPDVGYTEENDYCTGIAWSLPRAINQQDSPGLKSFLSSNTFFISDDQGEIKRAWDATSSKGDNLYAITDRGVALLLTNKSVLSGIDSSEIGVSFSDKFIAQEYWIDKRIGMNDEMWRSFAEASIVIKNASTGEESNVETLFFANDRSVYGFNNNQIIDIGKTGYYSELRNPLRQVLDGYGSRVAGFYDEKYEYYGLQLGWQVPVVGAPALDKEDLFVFSQLNRGFIGAYDYRFDSYLMNNNTLYGMRQGETYELDKGYIINGNPIEFSVSQASSMDPFFEKEFMFININSDEKPTRVEFYNADNQLLCALDPAIQGARYLKKYDGYYQHIPRQDAGISIGRDRVQDRLLVYKIIHNLEDKFVLKNSVVDYKIIK